MFMTAAELYPRRAGEQLIWQLIPSVDSGGFKGRGRPPPSPIGSEFFKAAFFGVKSIIWFVVFIGDN